MKDNYSCDIIRDLLLGYIDGVLSETGTKAVKNHLEQCESCHNAYEEMKAGVSVETVQTEQLALDGFKKIRKRTRYLKIAVGVVSGLLLAFLLSVFLAVFIIGNPISTHMIDVSLIMYDENTESLTIKGTINNSATSISRVVWKPSNEDTNAVNVLVYATETLPMLQPKNDFSITIPNMKGKMIYLACPDYDQLEVYNWKNEHYETIDLLRNEIYQELSILDNTRDILSYAGGIEVVDEIEGIIYRVDHLIGENTSYWRFNDQLITDGDLEPANFEIWISLEEPYAIRIYDFQTGEWTNDYSIISKRRPLE